jgi:hypothetical protein
MASVQTNTGLSMALYSDIVASRSPSPLKEDSSITVAPSVESPPDYERPPISPLKSDDNDIHNVDNNNVMHGEPITSSDESPFPQDPEDATWTTVRRRRARSLGSLALDRVVLESPVN